MSYAQARKQQDDEYRREFLAGASGVVEATTCEYAHIYEENYNRPPSIKRDWVEHLSSRGETVGYIEGQPVCISLRYDIIDGKKIVFVQAASLLVDWTMIREWLHIHMPDSAFRNREVSEDNRRLNYQYAENWYTVFQ